MARYRKVEVKTWNDGKFRDLTPIPPCGQGLWLWFLTGTRTTNIPGIVVGTDQVMAAELRWPLEAFREAFREAFDKGMAKGDWQAGLVWLPNASRPGDNRNKPESPNVIRSWRDTWEEIPECPLKLEVWQQLKAFAEAFGKGFGEAFLEACRKPWVKALPNQEQEQEQEQEQNLSQSARASGNKKQPAGQIPFELVQEFKAGYPEGIYRQVDWLDGEKLLNFHVDAGVPLEQITAGRDRYHAQCKALGNLRTRFVLSPLKFLDRDKPLFDEPFPLPADAAPRNGKQPFVRPKPVEQLEDEAIAKGIADGKSDQDIAREIEIDIDRVRRAREASHAQH